MVELNERDISYLSSATDSLTDKWKVRSANVFVEVFKYCGKKALLFNAFLPPYEIHVWKYFVLLDIVIQNVNLEQSENMQRHRTDGFSSSKSLVVRRGAPFKLSLQLGGREFDPKSDCLRVKVMLGSLSYCIYLLFSSIKLNPQGNVQNPVNPSVFTSGRLCVRMAVTFSKRVSSSRWTAYMESKNLDLQNPSVFISAPSSAPVGCYRFQLHVYSQGGRRRTALGKFLLLCNPWCGGE